MAVTVTFDPERILDMRERAAFFKKTISALHDAAREVHRRGEGFGPRKVFLADVAREAGTKLSRIAPVLVHGNNLGWLELARADLTAAMDPDVVDASELRMGGATFHFLVLPAANPCDCGTTPKINGRRKPGSLKPDRRRWLDNPAWLADALADNLVLFQSQVPHQWLPKIAGTRSQGNDVLLSFREYGCGAYGCVLPSNDADVVVKITTDQTEWNFVHHALDQHWAWPQGITRYYAAFPIRGEYKASKGMREERPAWALWRESATKVGAMEKMLKSHGKDGWGKLSELSATQVRELEDALSLIDCVYASGTHILQFVLAGQRTSEQMRWNWERAREQQEIGAQIIAEVDGNPMDGNVWIEAIQDVMQDITGSEDLARAVEMAAWVSVYQHTIVAMSRSVLLKDVGLALLYYFSNLVVMTDLHDGNFGVVSRHGAETWAITDPGNVLFMPEAW